MRQPLASTLPDFPWTTLEPAKQKAAQHPGGIINLSVGSPVDAVAPGVQLALAEHAASPGYPQTVGTQELRTSMAKALSRRFGIAGSPGVLPVVGTKEAIALLPSLLGVRGTVMIPSVAYPTYEVSALLAGATPVRADAPDGQAELVYLNSPSNPTGAVLSVEQMRAWVEYARQTGAIIASDECYLGLAWDAKPVSILHDSVCGGDYRNLIAIHSLSKTSNLASYRAGFFAGDPQLIDELAEVRKHAGLMVPGPVQAAMRAALDDDDQEALQRNRYARRRAILMRALVDAGFRIDHSEAGLYLWATRGEACWDTVDWLASRGVLVAPGVFYSPEATEHVRVGLTAPTEAIEQVAERLR